MKACCGISSKIFLSHNKRAAQIKLLLRDVDGTMKSRCHLAVSDRGRGARNSTFAAHDGGLQGLTLAHIAGRCLGLHHLTPKLYWPMTTPCLAVT